MREVVWNKSVRSVWHGIQQKFSKKKHNFFKCKMNRGTCAQVRVSMIRGGSECEYLNPTPTVRRKGDKAAPKIKAILFSLCD